MSVDADQKLKLKFGLEAVAVKEADALYQRLIDGHPTSPMVKQAEQSRTAFGHKRLKAGSVGGFRLDVMSLYAQSHRSFAKAGGARGQHLQHVNQPLHGAAGCELARLAYPAPR